jgi:hypothetical protein
MKIVKKVAVLEIGGSHDECLISQFTALKSVGVETYFISSEELWSRNSQLKELVDHFICFEIKRKKIQDFLNVIKLNSFFVKEGIELVVFNTAQGAIVRNFCLTASRKVQFAGIIHTINKFKKSFTQKIIHRKIKKYFVLNDHLLAQIQPPKGIEVRSFYPIRFPHFELELEKANNEFWIIIIGGVEFRRKDLMGSIDLMEQIGDENVRFIFLGKSDPNNPDVISFAETLERRNLSSQVQLFSEFIDEKTFDAYLKSADLIWPMVHPGTPSANEYFKNQIPGAMNISFSYGIPMLVHQEYVNQWDDLKFAFSYSLEGFKNDFLSAMSGKNHMKIKLNDAPKFSIEYQEKKYLDFLLFDHRKN